MPVKSHAELAANCGQDFIYLLFYYAKWKQQMHN